MMGKKQVDNEEYDAKSRKLLRIKMMIFIALEATVLSAVISLVSITLYTANTRRERRDTVTGVTHIIAGVMNPDLIPIFLEEGRDGPQYAEMERLLDATCANIPELQYMYIYQAKEDGFHMIYGSSEEFKENVQIGSVRGYYPSFMPIAEKLIAGEKIEPLEIRDKSGWFIMSYEPIYDRAGNCVAYVEANVSMMDAVSYIRVFTLRIVFVATSFLLLSIALGIWMASNYHEILDRQFENVRKAKEDADSANRAKTRFLANMSHEIRTPINTIMGMNEMILREDTKDVPKKYYSAVQGYSVSIKRASDILLGLINDILDLSKIESGKMNLVEQRYSTKDIILAAVSMIRVKSDDKGLNFKTEIDEQIPCVLYGDEGKLKQVILNLLSNAVKYTEEGGFVLKIAALEIKDDECQLYVGVKDTGIGIKSENIDKIFAPFERVDEGKNEGVQGTGLGLNISRQFVNLMGGELKCESEYGEGSVFFFTIKQKIVDATPIGPFTEKTDDKPVGRYIPKFVAPKAKIMIVDDNEMNIQVISNLLRGTKAQIKTAMSGKECLEYLKTEDYDLIFLDHMMPEMDGIETLKEIEKITVDVPVIALTANAAYDGRNYYIRQGFTDYLAKPVEGRVLEETIAKYLPDTLLEEVSDEPETEEEVKLSEALSLLKDEAGVSIEDGITYCGNAEALEKFIDTYCTSIDSKSKEIEEAYNNGDIELYTIKVHALKSTSRIIGASELADLAYRLEEAGKNGDRQLIDDNTERLLKLFRSYKEKLSAFIAKKHDESGKKTISKAELEDAYGVLKEVAQAMDYDSAEMIFKELENYRIEEPDLEKVNKLKELFLKMDWDEMQILL